MVGWFSLSNADYMIAFFSQGIFIYSYILSRNQYYSPPPPSLRNCHLHNLLNRMTTPTHITTGEQSTQRKGTLRWICKMYLKQKTERKAPTSSHYNGIKRLIMSAMYWLSYWLSQNHFLIDPVTHIGISKCCNSLLTLMDVMSNFGSSWADRSSLFWASFPRVSLGLLICVQ